MPRYNDQWLIDRTMFEYVTAGSCACCVGFLFMPGGTPGLIHSLSELETEAADTEISDLDKLPWPPDMKDEVWKERVRLRQYCKRKMPGFRQFYQQYHTEYERWFHALAHRQLCRYFQIPRTELLERLQQDKFYLHAAFGTVLCAVTEQVAHYDLTQYPVDGRGRAEVGFESILTYDRRGGFTITNATPETKQKWLWRQQALGGPKLLERNPKRNHTTTTTTTNNNDNDDDSEDDDDDAAEEQAPASSSSSSSVPSFRSDRRIVRLLIASCFAETLQQAFLKQHNTKTTTPDSKETTTKDATTTDTTSVVEELTLRELNIL